MKGRLKYQLNLFLLALMFYTRFHVGQVDYSKEKLNEAFRYFPLIGVLIGSIGTGVYYAFSGFVSSLSCIIISLASMVYVTGALHEDGFSDFFDGFGGGQSKEQILKIMKDHAVGAFGLLSLIFLFFLKVSLLLSISSSSMFLILICMHSGSRGTVLVYIGLSNYARSEKEHGKAEHARAGIDKRSLCIGLGLAFLPFLFTSIPFVLLSIILNFILMFFLRSYTERKIGGYTGDVLGALEQFSELITLFAYVASQTILSL